MELTGKPFFVRANEEADIRRCQGIVVAPETVTGGLFLCGQQCWDEGAVWWEEALADPPSRLATPNARLAVFGSSVTRQDTIQAFIGRCCR